MRGILRDVDGREQMHPVAHRNPVLIFGVTCFDIKFRRLGPDLCEQASCQHNNPRRNPEFSTNHASSSVNNRVYASYIRLRNESSGWASTPPFTRYNRHLA